MSEALLWTLQQGLGPAFTPYAREAWAALYGTIAQIMRNAAAGKSNTLLAPAVA